MSTGVFNTTQAAAKLPALSFSDTITRLAPGGGSPLFILTSMMKTEIAVQTEHGYFSKTMLFPSCTAPATSQAAGVSTLTVLDTANILAGMMLRVDGTDENMLVEAVLSPTSLQVRRGFGTVAAATIPANSRMWMAGNANSESSLRPGALRIDAVPYSNLTHTFRNTWAVSGSMAATELIAGGTNVAENRADAATFHADSIEKALFFSQKYNGSLNGQPLRTMEGLIANTVANAASNITTLGSTTNFTQLEAAIDPVFNQVTDASGESGRVMFVGGKAAVVLNAIGRLNGTYQLVEGATNFGLRFKSMTLSRGMFRIIEHSQFNAYGVGTTHNKMGVVVDLPTFSIAYLKGRSTTHKAFNSSGSDATDNGIDAEGGTLTTECTALFKNPQANAVLYNFTAAAAG